MEVLVTGGAGYVGSHACKALHQQGIKPVVIDNLFRGHEEAVKWGPLYRGEVSDDKLLEKVFKAHQIEAVFHFAALTYVGESNEDPIGYFKNNVGQTIELLSFLKNKRIKDFVFSSSCATYGEPTKIPITEDESQKPVSPYGRTKCFVELILKDLASAAGLRTVALRYFNAAGADLEGEIGEDHDPETHLIPLAIAAARNGTEIKIFGEDYPTADGTCVRDYIHVADLASAHIQALQWLQNQKLGTFAAFNIGCGSGYSVKQVLQAVEKVTAIKVKTKLAARREGDPPILVAEANRAKVVLNWGPKHSSLEEIVTSADQWYQKRFMRKKGPL